jgi:hypothetical protein
VPEVAVGAGFRDSGRVEERAVAVAALVQRHARELRGRPCLVRPVLHEARRERLGARARLREHEIVARELEPLDVVGQDRSQRLGHRHLADAGRRLRLPLALLVVPPVLDADRRDAVSTEAVQVRDSQRAEFAASEAREERRRSQRALSFGQSVD